MNLYKCISKDSYQARYNKFSQDCIYLVVAKTRGKAKWIAHSEAKKEGGLAYHGKFIDWRDTLEVKGINYKEAGIPPDDSPLWWVGIDLVSIMRMFLEDYYSGGWFKSHAIEYLDNHLDILQSIEPIIN